MPLMIPENPFPTVAKLAKECGAQWPHIDQAVKETARVETTLREVLWAAAPRGRLLDQDSSLVLCGSFARHEMVIGSDCDWTLLINGVVSNRHGETARLIDQAIREEGTKRGLKSPGASGTFGNLSFSHDLVHRIGGGSDSNENLTRRMLMLLESRPLNLSDADMAGSVWASVMRCILERYFEEDVHFKPDQRPVPRFLLNDLTRYWRTITVDYAAKYREQDGRKWAVRNAKLRFSRKLLFAAGLAFCFSCHLAPPKKSHEDLFGGYEGESSLPFIESAMNFARIPPLEYLAAFVIKFVKEDAPKRKLVSERIFGSYNAWLGLLGNDEIRGKLESLNLKDVKESKDEVFDEIRKRSTEFARGLQLLFFNRDHDDDPIAELSLEYIGF